MAQAPSMTPPPAPPGPIAPTTKRNWGRTAVIGVALIAGLWAAAMLVTSMSGSFGPSAFRIDTTLAATKNAVVGGTSTIAVTVTNTSGSEIKNFLIYANREGGDDWFRHHVVTDSGGCVAKRPLGRFECGPIANGSTATFTIQGRPTDAGKFNYGLSYADDRGGGSIAWAVGNGPDWSEAVRP